MLRNWTLTAVTGLALLAPFAAAPAAQAAGRESPPVAHDRDHDRDRDRDHDRWRHHRDFEVMYRSCCDAPWGCYGRFDERWDAERAEHNLRAQGFEAFVRD